MIVQLHATAHTLLIIHRRIGGSSYLPGASMDSGDHMKIHLTNCILRKKRQIDTKARRNEWPMFRFSALLLVHLASFSKSHRSASSELWQVKMRCILRNNQLQARSWHLAGRKCNECSPEVNKQNHKSLAHVVQTDLFPDMRYGEHRDSCGVTKELIIDIGEMEIGVRVNPMVSFVPVSACLNWEAVPGTAGKRPLSSTG